MSDQLMLFAFGLNHKTAPIEVRERLYIQEAEVPQLLTKLKETLTECFVLSTCNRTEIYGVSSSSDLDIEFYKSLLIDFKNARSFVKSEHFFEFVSCAACQQLFSVATSLDSKVVGDTQILSQLRRAYHVAKDFETTGKVLNQLSQRALKIGKKTYTDTGIHTGAASISLAAVELALETFGSLNGRTALVVGAGETARLTIESLIKKRIGKIILTNRTLEHAVELMDKLHSAFRFDSEVVDFAGFRSRIAESDIVVSSTSSPEPVIHERDVFGCSKPILMIDIAVPRDIDVTVGRNPNVILKNIDDLHAVLDRNHQRRVSDLPQVKKLVSKEMSDFLMWYYAQPLLPASVPIRMKPDPETKREILGVKDLLRKNVSYVHKLAMSPGRTIQDDIRSHVELVEMLKSIKHKGINA